MGTSVMKRSHAPIGLHEHGFSVYPQILLLLITEFKYSSSSSRPWGKGDKLRIYLRVLELDLGIIWG